MKLINLSALILAAPLVTAQTPPLAFSYQALVRDGAGAAVRNQAVGVRIGLILDSATASQVYEERHTPTTNNFGNINLAIGRGTLVSGSTSNLDLTRPLYINVAVDIAGGTSYTDLGTTQALSVPYAMYAQRSGSSASTPVQSEIRDADGNTRISTERNTNENIIRFDLNGTEKMRLRGNALELPNAGQSVYIGDSAGANVSMGILDNVFVGNHAGRSNTTGFGNTFSGSSAGYSNSTGNRNTFSGSFSGFSNSTGAFNTFSGFNAGRSNTTGNDNTFSGSSAGFYNSSGNDNTFFGSWAGSSNTTGYRNTFSGSYAGRVNTTGGNNTFSGYSAGFYNSTGFGNTISGSSAGYSNTTGNYNTFTGNGAGLSNTTGYGNTFEGYETGLANTTGYYNTFAGATAGYSNTTGNYNTYVGNGAGFNNTTGDNNVFIGFNAGATGTVENNKLFINNTFGDPLIWGDFATDSVRIYGGMSVMRSISATAFNVSSDRRLKENIQPVANALVGVGKMNGVYYNYKANAPDGNPYPQGRQIGVIAQDVEKVYPELVAAQPGGYKAVDYPKLTAVLIEAVKELNGKVDRLEAELRQARTVKSGDKVAKR